MQSGESDAILTVFRFNSKSLYLILRAVLEIFSSLIAAFQFVCINIETAQRNWLTFKQLMFQSFSDTSYCISMQDQSGLARRKEVSLDPFLKLQTTFRSFFPAHIQRHQGFQLVQTERNFRLLQFIPCKISSELLKSNLHALLWKLCIKMNMQTWSSFSCGHVEAYVLEHGFVQN